MIRLSLAGKILYRLLTQIVVLLVICAMLFMLSAAQAIPELTLIQSLPSQWITIVTARIVQSLILTGIVSAGVAMCLTCNLNHRLLLWLYRAWTGLNIASLILGGFDVGVVLNIVTIALLLGFIGLSLCNHKSPFMQMWHIGVLMIIVTIMIPLLLSDSPLITLFRIHVSYGITGISIMFWLMTRWSNVRAEWARDGVRIVSALIALAGTVISFGSIGLPLIIAIPIGLLILICYTIFGGHSYRALRDRNQNMSLSPHWIAIAVLFWMIGGGFLGVIGTVCWHIRSISGHTVGGR